MSSSSGEDFEEYFVLRGPQIGFLKGFCLSPNGLRLLTATPHSLAVIDTRLGRHQALVHTGLASNINAATWLSDTQCLIACSDGHLYVASFRAATVFGFPVVTISYEFQDIRKPVVFLRYDLAQKLLAICYEDGVSLWQTVESKWRLIDRISIVHYGLPGVRTAEFFGTPERQLFIGGGFGHVIWVAPGEVHFFTGDRRVCQIGHSALSHDEEYLVVSTLEQHVCVWRLDRNTLHPGGTYELETGHEYCAMSPQIPVAMTSSHLVVSGSQVGHIAFIRANGISASGFYFEPNVTVTGLVTHKDRLFAALMGPSGCVVVVAYSDEPATRRSATKLQARHESNPIPPTTHIRIDQIPKLSLDGKPRQTGRVEFENDRGARPRQWLRLVATFLSLLAVFYLIDSATSYERFQDFWLELNRGVPLQKEESSSKSIE